MGSEPFLGSIGIFAGKFAPRGWAFCSGQLLAIQQHSALFALLGRTYGGDGRTSFRLPDLRGRVPIHVGEEEDGPGPGLSPYQLGQKGGREAIILSDLSLASKTITIGNSGDSSQVNVTTILNNSNNSVDLRPPFLGVNFCIALEGIFPSRS